MDKVCASISSALAPLSECVKSIHKEVSALAGALSDLLGSMAGTELAVGTTQDSGSIADSFVAIYGGIMRFVDGVDMAEKSSGKLLYRALGRVYECSLRSLGGCQEPVFVGWSVL